MCRALVFGHSVSVLLLKAGQHPRANAPVPSFTLQLISALRLVVHQATFKQASVCPSRLTTRPGNASKQAVVQAIQRLEREQQTCGLPLSRFIDSIRPGKGKRKGRDDDGDEAADDGHHSAHQHDPHAALLQVCPQCIHWASQARRCTCCRHHELRQQSAACILAMRLAPRTAKSPAGGVRCTRLLACSGEASPEPSA